MCARVMLAEDDERQAEALRRYLAAEGHEATIVHDGEAALRQARQQAFDLLLLDVMLPKLDGMEVCRILRQESDVLMLMLTARSGEDDLLRGLDLGADDYMTKPFSPRELVARVRTLLRRVPTTTQQAPVHRVGRLAVDEARHTVTAGGVPVDCTAGEFAILAAMTRQPGRVFTRGQLLAHTRGIDRESTGRTIDVHVMNLRRKIEANPRRPRQLLTVYGVGYKLTAGTP
ncbi:response regulator transcription factor [Micromonospora sp. WMMD1128]|uniref:response regulator transcription factor n=1 Tax=unclassified Micromonospora TaxID=2617518 RepID=UPI00248AC977|nr:MULTISPECIES: response regulator transcription factor [unclassified Micromonospora]WBB73967.1 response regulator transcription factor [Micromonospora sp. WMMD1128]WFE32639.1 response regulator transcription factor [Micromonospora sp. WMMD975]